MAKKYLLQFQKPVIIWFKLFSMTHWKQITSFSYILTIPLTFAGPQFLSGNAEEGH